MGDQNHACTCGGGAYSIDFSGRKGPPRPCTCHRETPSDGVVQSGGGSTSKGGCGCDEPSGVQGSATIALGDSSDLADTGEAYEGASSGIGSMDVQEGAVEQVRMTRAVPIGARRAVAPRLNLVLPSLPDRVAVRAPDGSGAILYMDRRMFEQMRREAALARSRLPAGSEPTPRVLHSGPLDPSAFYGGAP